MGNCVSSTTGVEHRGETKPASLIGSVDHLGSVSYHPEHAFYEFVIIRETRTMSQFHRMAISRCPCRTTLTPSYYTISCQVRLLLFRISIQVLLGGNEISLEDLNRTEERRGSATPSLARSEEADCAVVAGYAEPHAFRLLRRQNDQSSIEALGKALRDDPNIRDTNLRVEGAPSRRPTALGVPGMQ